MKNSDVLIAILAMQGTIPFEFREPLSQFGKVWWPSLFLITDVTPSHDRSAESNTISFSEVLGDLYKSHLIIMATTPYITGQRTIGYIEDTQYEFLEQRVLADTLLARKTIVVTGCRETSSLQGDRLTKLIEALGVKVIRLPDKNPAPLLTSVRARLRKK